MQIAACHKCIFADVRYEYVVDKQPIGKLLFRQWCESKRSQYHRYLKFLEVTERYDVETDEQRVELAATIRKDFMAGSEGGEPLILPEVGIEQVRHEILLAFFSLPKKAPYYAKVRIWFC